jgi:long-chain acyl-CoA synthetase
VSKKRILLENDDFNSFSGTLPQLLVMQAAHFGTERAAIREKAYGIWQTLSWKDYLRYVKHAALGLITLGFRRGETSGLITGNHPEPFHIGRRR